MTFTLAVIGVILLCALAVPTVWFGLTVAVAHLTPRHIAARLAMQTELKRLGVNVDKTRPEFIAGLARAADLMASLEDDGSHAVLMQYIETIARFAVRHKAGLTAEHEESFWQSILKLGFGDDLPHPWL